MKHQTWFFVTDHDGMELAAFPERDLAEAYMEDMPWEIDERAIAADSTFVSATLYDETLRRSEGLQLAADCLGNLSKLLTKDDGDDPEAYWIELTQEQANLIKQVAEQNK